MPRPITLAAVAVAVVASTLLATVAVPGVLADPSAGDPVRPGPVRLTDVSIAEGAVGGETATLRVELVARQAESNLVALGLLAVFAGLQLYLDRSTVISQWVATEYRSAVRAGFNLAVLLGALAAIYGLLERLRGGDDGRNLGSDRTRE